MLGTTDGPTARQGEHRHAERHRPLRVVGAAMPAVSMPAAVAWTRRLPGRPRRPLPRRWLPTAVLTLAGLGLGITTGLTITAETGSELAAPGGLATFLGSLTGFVGTYLALLMVLLISRIPAVERVLGQDGLVHWHRALGPWPITLITLHAILLTVGYAEAAHSGTGHEIAVLFSSYPDMGIATVGLAFMVLAGLVTIRAVRNRLRRETWWLVHLGLYLALALSFAHVLVLGPSFVGHPITRAVWSAIWLATAGTVLTYRVGLPVVRSMRHRLSVVEVRPEAPGVTSVLLTGRGLDRLAVDGGQFFLWRFLVRGLWWQAHPYSLSALPQPPYLRLTVKQVGDHSAALARLRPGTRVAVEGPYGAFTRHSRTRPKAALIAAGIGITALRSLLEDLPQGCAPAVIVRASSAAQLVLREEVRELVHQKHGRLHELVGSRQAVGWDTEVLRRLVPDLNRRDVYVCGPAGFVQQTVEMAQLLDVPAEALHHEAFSL